MSDVVPLVVIVAFFVLAALLVRAVSAIAAVSDEYEPEPAHPESGHDTLA
jgi:hypothetical protein